MKMKIAIIYLQCKDIYNSDFYNVEIFSNFCSCWVTNYKVKTLQPFYTMAQSTPFIVLVTVLLINILSYCSAENVYCVTPIATSCSSCPHNTHCATLSEYAQEAELYFTSKTTWCTWQVTMLLIGISQSPM